MENFEIAEALQELADLLEIKGANPFRIRAYRNAIRTINAATRPLKTMPDDGIPFTELAGVGKDIAGHIEELLDTGRLTVLEEVSREIPRELVTLVKLDGVGPKKAKKLWEELDITSVDALEAAVSDGRVAELAGFSTKSAEKILQSIADLREHQARTLLFEADDLVKALLEYLREAPGVEDVVAAGSYRRRRETVGDLDILALATDAAAPGVMEHFLAYPGGARVEAEGGTKSRIRLRGGLSVDLRVLPRESYGAALHYFTGSMEHNVAVRKIAVRRGLRISEYGVFEDDEQVGGATEEEVFLSVGLAWIPPVLRENRGEIEAAREGRLPKLIAQREIRGDLHMHSRWSDGKQTILEMAEACRERGYEYLAITDHSKAVTVANGLDEERVREQAGEVAEVRAGLEGITLFHGLEVDILKDGTLDLADEVLDELDLVIVSVHSFMNMTRSEMTDRVIRALQHPAVDILAHPTGRILNRRMPYDIDIEAVLNAARELDVAVELNASPYRLDLSDLHLFRARELGVRVAIDTDAHGIADLPRIDCGIDQAQRGWLEAKDVLNTLPLEDFRTWLGRRGGAGAGVADAAGAANAADSTDSASSASSTGSRA